MIKQADFEKYDIFEGMTSISAVIRSIREGLSDRVICEIRYDLSRERKMSRELRFLRAVSSELSFELIPTDTAEIDAVTNGTTHGGVIAVCSKRSFPSLNDNFLTSGSFYVLCEGIEDPYNFGYSVRSLYAAGADGIILPPRNWMEISGTVARCSAGTSELANIAISDPIEAVKLFKDRNFKIVCAGIRDSVSIHEYDFKQPILLIVGGEKRGISGKILEMSDATVRIEYGREFMGSLPTSSAVSVIAFEIAHQKSLSK